MDLTFIVNCSAGPFLKKQQFKKRGNTYYKYDDKAFYAIYFYSIGLCSYYVMPFFIPCNFEYLTYGDQLSISLFSNEKRPDNQTIEQWTNKFINEYFSTIKPFFQAFSLFLDSSEKSFGYPQRVCTDIEISRLMIFLFLYRGDLINAKEELAKYEELLLHGNYFSKRVVERREAEVKEIYNAISRGEDQVKDYISQTILNTKKVLRI